MLVCEVAFPAFQAVDEKDLHSVVEKQNRHMNSQPSDHQKYIQGSGEILVCFVFLARVCGFVLRTFSHMK